MGGGGQGKEGEKGGERRGRGQGGRTDGRREGERDKAGAKVGGTHFYLEGYEKSTSTSAHKRGRLMGATCKGGCLRCTAFVCVSSS